MPRQTQPTLLADARDASRSRTSASGAGRPPVRDRFPTGGRSSSVPPGGAARRPSGCSDARSTAGVRRHRIGARADRRTLLIAQGSSAGLGELNPTTGKIYVTEIQPDGSPGSLRLLWESGPADLPDGFTIAQSGKLYVPLAGGANQIAVVAPDGRELERFPSSPGDGNNGSSVPFDTPSSARFLGTRLIVANQSFTGNRDNQVVLDVETGETGLPELIPGLDRTPPRLSRVSLSRKRVAAGGRARERVRFSVSERSTVTFRVERRGGGRWSITKSFTRRRDAGRGSVTFRTRGLRTGRHRVVVRARTARATAPAARSGASGSCARALRLGRN